jgi:hypothetical protein
MLRPALLAINWEAEGETHLPALLGRGTFVSDAPGKSIKLSLEAAFAGRPVTFCELTYDEGDLAPAAHEDARVCINVVPLLVTGLLGRMPFSPLPRWRLMRVMPAWLGMEKVLRRG